MGTQKNHLNEMVLLSTKYKCLNTFSMLCLFSLVSLELCLYMEFENYMDTRNCRYYQREINICHTYIKSGFYSFFSFRGGGGGGTVYHTCYL